MTHDATMAPEPGEASASGGEREHPAPRARPSRTVRHIRVPRTARYHVLGDPARAREVWFGIHGYGQLAYRFLEPFRALPGVGTSRCVVAPEALSRFYVETRPGPHGRTSWVGASWMTRWDREHEIADYLEYLDRVAGEVLAEHDDDPEIVVLGFSQGCETASRWVTYGAVRPARLVLWGGGLAADLDLGRAAAALAGTEIRLVVGDDDAWARDTAAAAFTKLRDAGLAVERLDYAGGHRMEGDVLARGWPARR